MNQGHNESALNQIEIARALRKSTRTIRRWMLSGMPFECSGAGGEPSYYLSEVRAWRSRMAQMRVAEILSREQAKRARRYKRRMKKARRHGVASGK